MPDFADSPTTELQRKVAALRWVCVFETLAYAVLVVFWVGHSTIGLALMGSIHGMVFLAFSAMTFGLYKALGWSTRFLIAAVVTGPVGALLVFEKLRRVDPTRLGVAPSAAAAARAAAQPR